MLHEPEYLNYFQLIFTHGFIWMLSLIWIPSLIIGVSIWKLLQRNSSRVRKFNIHKQEVNNVINRNK